MKKFLKWAAIAFVGLAVLGAIFGESDEKKNDTATAAAQTTEAANSAETTAEEQTTTEQAPPPKPSVELAFNGPLEVHRDQVTLRGTVTSGSKVKVDGKRAAVTGGRWTKVVSTSKRGENEFKVVARKSGFVTDTYNATVVRKLSAAEKAAIRVEKAQRRANQRALESAESYLAMSGFSKQGLYEQLSSSAGEGFTEAEAQYAVDHVDADWNAEAVESAKSYLQMSPMSRQELIEQLSSSAGEGFTYEQAVYAVNKVY